MYILLRILLIFMLTGLILLVGSAFHLIYLPYSHIAMAISFFLYVIFSQAFVMFYFIGVSRLAENIYAILYQEKNLHELFQSRPENLEPYKIKARQYYESSVISKRQTIPWTILILVLGMIAFLLGGAYDTHLVHRFWHTGTTLSFSLTLMIGFFRQWFYLGKSHRILKNIKNSFNIAHSQM